MSRFAKHGWFLFLLALIALALPASASNVTISGAVTFASIDGSSLDDDHTANGVFTVNGDLTVLGFIVCTDPSGNGCPMQFVVTGNFTMATGSAIVSDNQSKQGSGGNISFVVGGNSLLQGSSGSSMGAIISSAQQNDSGNGQGGSISLTTGGTFTQGGGSLLTSSSKNTAAGAISIQSGGLASVGGSILATPTRTLGTTFETGDIVTGGGNSAAGGPISIKALTHSEPGLIITGSALIASQGNDGGAGTVALEGCDVRIDGLVASVSRKGTGARVVVRSGTNITIDSSNLAAGSGAHLGHIRADSIHDSATGFHVDLFAGNAVTVIGPSPASSLFSVTSNGGDKGGDDCGTINVVSPSGTIVASGNAFAATSSDKDDHGGTINASAKGNINLDGATLNASGGTTGNNRAGGHINVRSYSGAISWVAGVGDVRPVGSTAGVPAAQQGTINLTYCTTLATAGSSFPTNGSPVGVWPTTAQTCSPAAPSLPSGESLPDCNDPPVAANDAYTVAEGGTLTVPPPGVLANDSDPDGDPITAILVSGPAHATSFSFNADGSFNYVHNGGETTSDSFTYKANDGSLDSNVATVNITITPVNDAPVANDDNYTVAEGGSLNVAPPGVLANDNDPDGPTATAILVSGPAHALSFGLNPNGSFSYVHDGSETTSDTFTYKVSDGSLFSNTATVHITVTPVNDAPVANDDSYTVAEGGTLTVSAPGVIANDTDPDSPSLTATLVGGPAHASSFTFNADGSFSYTHDGSETTSDSFTYKVSDGSLFSNTATVHITVTPVNDAPVAVADAYSVAEGGTLNVPSPGVLGNDTDADSPTLTAVLVSGPAHATSFALNPNGSFSYQHDGSETLSDSFTYKANDGSLDSNVVTVTITITPVNDAPTANNDAYTVAEGGTLSVATPGVLGNDTDPDSPVLTVALVSGPAHASSFTLNPNGSFSYTHDGSETLSDSFTYKANDGSLDSNVATVNITITPVNDAPVADDDAYNVAEGGTLNIVAPGVLGNDSDVDSPTLNAVLVSGPAHAASFVLNANGGFNYVHDGSETTSDSFTYKANDGSLDSNVATVTITVSPVDDAPVITAGNTITFTEGDPATVIDNTITITDADSTTLASAVVQITGNYASGQDVLSFTNTPNITGSFNSGTGTLTLTGVDTIANYQAALRSVTYSNTSDAPSSAPRTVSWTVNDGTSNSNTATSTINVVSVNDAPVLTGGSSINYIENDPATVINSVITISDVDSATLAGATIQITGNYANGQDVLSFTNLGSITGSFNASTGTLTLSGTDTVANYQTALRSVKYRNMSDDPSTGTRTVTFQVDDGASSNNLSNTINSSISITAVNDAPVPFAYAGLPAQAGIPITYPAGKLGATDAEAGTTITIDTTPINLVNVASLVINGDGSFTLTPTVASAGGSASFQYRVSDNGNPAPGVNSSYVTVSFSVAGPAIYFTKSAAVGAGNCTLGNECTVATAVSQIGASTNRNIFIGDAGSQSPGTIALNSGGTIIGQGVTAASFDALYGIGTPSQGTLAPRPAVNQPRPTLSSSNITLNTNSQVRGFNLAASLGEALVANTKTGLVVSDLSVSTTTNNSAQYAVDFVNSSGTFSFGNVTVASSDAGSGVNFSGTTSASTVSFGNVSTTTGDAVTVASSGSTNFTFGTVTATTGTSVDVNTATGAFSFTAINGNGAAKSIVVNALTGGGSFTVNGTGGACSPGNLACTGGTIQNDSDRGAEFVSANNITLKNMYFNNANTTNGADPTVSPSTCGDIANPASDNTGCNAAIYLRNVAGSGALLDTILVDGAAQIGINGNNVNGFTLRNSTVQNAGNQAKESGIYMKTLNGTVILQNDSLQNDNAWPLRVQNYAGSVTMTVDNVSFTGLGKLNVAGIDGFLFGHSTGAGSSTITVQNSRFFSNRSFGAQFDAPTGTITATFNNNDFGTTNGVAVSNGNGNGIALTTSSTGVIDYSITNNRLYGQDTVGIVLSEAGSSTAASHISGTISGNTIGDATVVNSGAGSNGNGIQINGQGAGAVKANILNNTISQVTNTGINIETMTGSSVGVFHIKGNTLLPGLTPANFAISIWAGNTSTDTSNVCAEIGGTAVADKNTILGTWSSAVGIRTRHRFAGTTYNVSGYTGGGTNMVALQAYITANNVMGANTVLSSTQTAYVSTGATCTTVTP